MPPKSILKKPAVPATTEPAAKAPNPRHLQVALHHANIIEERKRVEAGVLDAIIALMDYPTASDADPKRPSAADAQRLRDAVIPTTTPSLKSATSPASAAMRCVRGPPRRPARRRASSSSTPSTASRLSTARSWRCGAPTTAQSARCTSRCS
jgi:hypothetical protein